MIASYSSLQLLCNFVIDYCILSLQLCNFVIMINAYLVLEVVGFMSATPVFYILCRLALNFPQIRKVTAVAASKNCS